MVTKCKKYFFQNSMEYRTSHFNISVASKFRRDSKNKFAGNFLWACLLCWFTLATKFPHYIPAACVTKRLLIFNISYPSFEYMEIWTLNWPIRLFIFWCSNDSVNYFPMISILQLRQVVKKQVVKKSPRKIRLQW